jgi:hypothetical protein
MIIFTFSFFSIFCYFIFIANYTHIGTFSGTLEFNFESQPKKKHNTKNKIKKEKLITTTFVYEPDAIHDGVNYTKALRKLKWADERSKGKKQIKLGSVKRELFGSKLYKTICGVSDVEIDIFQLRDEILRMIKVVSNDLPKARQLGLLD